jgi:hypothetical protein
MHLASTDHSLAPTATHGTRREHGAFSNSSCMTAAPL